MLKISKYLLSFEKRFWQNNTDKPFPEIILVCPNNAAKNYLEKTITGKLKEKGFNMNFYLSTWEEIQERGMRKEVLRKVK